MNLELENYIKTLNPEQKQAVMHEGSPLLILAGAGSGKTRVITTKIAYLINEKNIDPYSILSVTFTKKAANEMKQRAILLEPKSAYSQIRTFHSFGTWFLRKYREESGLTENFTIYDDEASAILVRQIEPGLSPKECKLAAKQIALAKDYGLTANDDLSVIASDFDLQSIYQKYTTRLRATGNADFGDLILLPYQVIKSYSHVKKDIHSRFGVIMVDEYQDSNIAQFNLLKALSGVDEQNNSYVCVVGDDDQSIYHFRGAEVSNILHFPHEFTNTQIIKLEKNYRSTEQILNAASLVVSNNENRLGKTLQSQREDGKKPILAFLEDSNMETKFCAEIIEKSVENGTSYKDWAIFYRTNAQSLGFEKELVKRKIPYVVVGSLKFYEREEIKDSLAYLSLVLNPKDEISFRRIVNKPTRGIGEKKQEEIIKQGLITVTDDGKMVFDDLLFILEEQCQKYPPKAKEQALKFVNFFKKLRESFTGKDNLSDFIQQLIEESGLIEHYKEDDEIEGTQRVENLSELVNSAVPYECSRDGLVDFLDAINLDRTLAQENETDSNDKVTLITLHNTKGLEFNKVIITGLEQGIFPREDKIGLDLEEERRLFYVGITRAKDELYITSTGRRVLYGSFRVMAPSIFLQEVKPAVKIIGNETKPSLYNIAQNELSSRWKKGVKLYHDDYGYGTIILCQQIDDEYIITVQFETGTKKKFIPKYQSKSLMIIK